MKFFAKEQLSPHKYKTKEGYLICTDAILARTGKQMYKKGDFFPDAADASADYEVDRKEEDVFDEKTIASFENQPLVVNHPNEDVNSHNYKQYEVGFVRDVHKGEFNGQPVLLGNLVIRDADTIRDIEAGQYNQLSCGYDCDISDEEHPCQTNIRGNHVALCKEGRAGIAKIQDSVQKTVKYGFQTEKQLKEFEEFCEKLHFTVKRLNNNECEVSGPHDSGMWAKVDNTAKILNTTGSLTKDVEPHEGEDKQAFISRFMGATKGEYPDRKQRLAVAYSYWDKHHDSLTKDYNKSWLRTTSRYEDDAIKQGFNVEKYGNEIRVWGPRFKLEQWIKSYDADEPIHYAQIKDSCKDAIDTKSKLLNALNSLKGGWHLTKEGQTFSGRKHFEFETKEKIDNIRQYMELVDKLVDRFDEAYHCLSTYNGAQMSDGRVHVVIDVDDKRAHDSLDVHDALKVAKIVKIAKLSHK